MKKILPLLIAVVLLLIPTSALAKGSFSYLTVKGPRLNEDLKVTESALLNFFTFADFFKGSVDVPANPGEGYEVTRTFVDSETRRVQNFDMLHYYPDTGYVYYDGLINGSSEYDGKWYKAHPEVEAEFRSELAKPARLNWIAFAALFALVIISVLAYRMRAQSPIANQNRKSLWVSLPD